MLCEGFAVILVEAFLWVLAMHVILCNDDQCIDELGKMKDRTPLFLGKGSLK